jgi:hypothetical protein
VLERREKYLLADEAIALLHAALESEESLSAQLTAEGASRTSADRAGVAPPESSGRVCAGADCQRLPVDRRARNVRAVTWEALMYSLLYTRKTLNVPALVPDVNDHPGGCLSSS